MGEENISPSVFAFFEADLQKKDKIMIPLI